jgi:hypothetical protein
LEKEEKEEEVKDEEQKPTHFSLSHSLSLTPSKCCTCLPACFTFDGT